MRARLQWASRRINWLAVGAVGLSVFMGLFVAVFGAITNGELTKMVALPAFLVLLILLAVDRRFLLLSVLVLRASGDLVLSSTKVGALINAFVILLSVLLVLEQPKRFPGKPATPWLIFLAISLYALVISPNLVEGVRLWLSLISYFAIFVSGFYLVRSKEDLMFCIKIVLWSSLLPTLYAFVDFALRHGAANFRLRSTFGHPNIFGFYLTLIIALSFYMMKSLEPRRDNAMRVAYGCYIFVLLGLLALTQTRSAWLGCFLIFFGYALFFERRYFIYMGVLGMVALAVPGVLDRLADLTQNTEISATARLNSYAWRKFLWESAFHWMEFRDYFFGRGLQSFREESIVFFPQASGVNWNAHSAYVQVIFEMGVVGALAFVSLYLSVLRRMWALRRAAPLFAYIIAAVVVSYMFAAYSDNVLDYLSFDWYLWFVLGIASAYALSLQAPAAPARATVPPSNHRSLFEDRLPGQPIPQNQP